MNTENTNTATRLGGYAAIAGSVIMLIGAALNAMGASLDAALVDGDIAGYLTAAGATRQLFTTNLTLWIVGVLILGVAGTVMASLSGRRPMTAQMAKYNYGVAVPLAITSFVAWLAVVVQIGPETSPEAIMAATVMGWFATYTDWIATILILSVGPSLISMAGRGEWTPTWLVRWSVLAAITGLLTVIAMLTGGAGLLTYGMLILPVGIGWMIAAGIVLLRHDK